MPIQFPPSPSVNQEYTYEGKVWAWDGSSWVGVRQETGIQKSNIWAKQNLLIPKRGFGLNSGYNGTTDQRRTKAGTIPMLKQYMERDLGQFEIDQVVTSGLVLYLDAGNVASYPGSGTTWTDLSGNGNNVTLTNGPTYSSANGGSIVFDGTNDYADFFATNLGTTTTVEMWVKLGAGYSGKMFFGWGIYNLWCAAGHLGYNTGSGDIYGISSSTVSSLGLVGNWKHYVFEMRSDVSYTNNKIYINTISQTISQQNSSENAGGRTFNSGNGRISGWRNDTNYPIPMNCSSFKVYNRALSSNEVLQNYNALRGRYGL